MFYRFLRIVLLLVFGCGIVGVTAQDYIRYHQLFNRIDRDIDAKNPHASLPRLDTVLQQYEFIYARHCIKGLQICCSLNDSLRAEKFLRQCFLQGVPLWVLRTNLLTAPSLGYPQCKATLLLHDSLVAVYKSRLNQDLVKKVDSLIQLDQYHTDRLNSSSLLTRYPRFVRWKRNSRKQYRLICAWTRQYGFPGERLIGLPEYYNDSSSNAKQILFYGPCLINTRLFTMLQHYYSHPREGVLPAFKQAVAEGYMPPEQCGTLYDFVARWGKGKFGSDWYNVRHRDHDSTHLPIIEQRRAMIGLNTCAEQKNNMLINRERRKRGTASREILRETE